MSLSYESDAQSFAYRAVTEPFTNREESKRRETNDGVGRAGDITKRRDIEHSGRSSRRRPGVTEARLKVKE